MKLDTKKLREIKKTTVMSTEESLEDIERWADDDKMSNSIFNIDAADDNFNTLDDAFEISNNDITLKQIYELIQLSSSDNAEPLAFNSSYMTLQLLDSDIDNYIKKYEELLSVEMINKLVDIKYMIKDLLSCLK
jgi:hypothetical protein